MNICDVVNAAGSLVNTPGHGTIDGRQQAGLQKQTLSPYKHCMCSEKAVVPSLAAAFAERVQRKPPLALLRGDWPTSTYASLRGAYTGMEFQSRTNCGNHWTLSQSMHMHTLHAERERGTANGWL